MVDHDISWAGFGIARTFRQSAGRLAARRTQSQAEIEGVGGVMKTNFASIAAVAVLAGCVPTPFPYIDGRKYHKAELNTSSVIVLDVDGKSDTRNPVMVDPGRRVIRVQGPAGGGFGEG